MLLLQCGLTRSLNVRFWPEADAPTQGVPPRVLVFTFKPKEPLTKSYKQPPVT